MGRRVSHLVEVLVPLHVPSTPVTVAVAGATNAPAGCDAPTAFATETGSADAATPTPTPRPPGTGPVFGTGVINTSFLPTVS